MQGENYYMKTKIISTIILCLIAFTKAYSAQVGFFVGEVSGERKGRPFRINMGMTLETGDLIRTGNGGTAEIHYPNNTRITLRENTLVKIGNENIPASNEVTVVSGNALAVFAQGSGNRNRAYTPTTVAAVRGTEFEINVNNGNSTIILNKGKLNVSNTYSQVSLNAGQNVQTNVGAGVGKPTKNSKQSNRKQQQQSEDMDKLAQDFNRYVDGFDSRAKAQSNNTKKFSDELNSATTNQKMAVIGKNIEQAEESMRDELFLIEGVNQSLSLILNNLPDKSSKEFIDFSQIRERSTSVASVKARNFAEIQAVKQQHQEAVDKIRYRFEADRARILEGTKGQ